MKNIFNTDPVISNMNIEENEIMAQEINEKEERNKF